ncbi:MAG: LLM class flavin-dependent oxidoreductase [Actinomycetota bacterium]|nr:LLM class flavin-dependent oxidoreductase [Actinomycetota bacterium]
MTIRFGVTLPQFTSDPDRFAAGVQRAGDLGFDSVWVFDHIWPLGGEPDRPILECWSALAWLAVRTDLQIGTLVTRSSLRHPALLGKMAATLGAIAPGRVTVAIGSGDHMNRGENESIGAPFFSGMERIRQLVSTVTVVQRFLSLPEVTLADAFMDVKSLPATPRPAVAPAVWVGGRSNEILEVAGRLADGWNGWGANVDAFAADAAKVRSVAGERRFEISWAGQVVLDEPSPDRLPGHGKPADRLAGSPEEIAAALERVVDAGATHLIASVPSVTPDDYDALAAVAARLKA